VAFKPIVLLRLLVESPTVTAKESAVPLVFRPTVTLPVVEPVTVVKPETFCRVVVPATPTLNVVNVLPTFKPVMFCVMAAVVVNTSNPEIPEALSVEVVVE
jgi:hypothetical protein